MDTEIVLSMNLFIVLLQAGLCKDVIFRIQYYLDIIYKYEHVNNMRICLKEMKLCHNGHYRCYVCNKKLVFTSILRIHNSNITRLIRDRYFCHRCDMITKRSKRNMRGLNKITIGKTNFYEQPYMNIHPLDKWSFLDIRYGN